MFTNIYELSISLVAGLFLGIIISWLYWQQKVGERDDHIEDLETTFIEKVEYLNKRAEYQEANLARLNSELKKREEDIINLNAKVKEKDDLISGYEKNVNNLEKQNSDRIAQVENSEARIRDLENSFNEKELKIDALSAKVNAMQDDLSFLDGIGPKVSTVLRLAGITSFARLASTDVNRIRDILEEENPNLLRLTNPSTWPEQAKMAAEGKWDALLTLQNDLKNARRDKETKKEDSL